MIRTKMIAVGSMFLLGTLAVAETYYLAVDVPSELGATDYLPSEIVRSQFASYTLEQALPEGTDISAVHLAPDGQWLFVPAHPVTLGGAHYEPRDVVSTDGVTFSLELDGEAAGISTGVRIDALFLDPAGRPVLSFDVPAKLGNTTFGPSDLVVYDSGFSIYWFADPVPDDANVVGASEDGTGRLILSFDVPMESGGVLYEPGDLVEWDGSAFSTRFKDAAWPPYAQLRDFSFAPFSGAVPLLQIEKGKDGDLDLSWGASCAPGDTDYAVYEGVIGAFDSHVAKQCSTGGATRATVTPDVRDSYYLVAPHNALREGSHGIDSAGFERSQGAGACKLRAIGVCQ